MTSLQRKALHFVLRVGDRQVFSDFLKDDLGMRVLRHEEFEEGCKARCNGPYEGQWSKTMIGHGSEDKHFVIEMIYNVGIYEYKHGNDYLGITIRSKEAANKVRVKEGVRVNGKKYTIHSEGYPFHIIDEEKPGDPIVKVSLAVADIERSYAFWVDVLGMMVIEGDQASSQLLLAYGEDQVQLELIKMEKPIDRADAYGRIAFSCTEREIGEIKVLMDERYPEQKKSQVSVPRVMIDRVTLCTPDKASVEVIILQDPDGHEICFVNMDSFKQLSKVEQNGEALLQKSIKADLSKLFEESWESLTRPNETCPLNN